MRFKYLLTGMTILGIALFSGCEKKEETKNESVGGEIKITENVVKEQKAKEEKANSGQFYYSYNTL